MESIESWHAERVELPLQFESYAVLRDRGAITDITRLSVARGQEVRTDVPVLWAREDLFRHEATYVPYDLVTLNTVHPPNYRPTFLVSSDGLASGNHLLEAVVHGLCERIERDSAALWFASSEEPRQLDLTSVDDPDCRYLLNH